MHSSFMPGLILTVQQTVFTVAAWLHLARRYSPSIDSTPIQPCHPRLLPKVSIMYVCVHNAVEMGERLFLPRELAIFSDHRV